MLSGIHGCCGHQMTRPHVTGSHEGSCRIVMTSYLSQHWRNQSALIWHHGLCSFWGIFQINENTFTHLLLDPFVYCDHFSCYRDWSNPIYFWTIRRWFVKNGLIKSLTILYWFTVHRLEHFVTNWHQEGFLTQWLCSLVEESHVTESTDAAVMITMMMMTTAASNDDQSDDDFHEMILIQVSRWWLVWQSDDHDRGERRREMQQV